ncbi:2-amino-4-hydroxy-6-hydroxymethyldihydropteridine diphosphokinase [Kallipyga massiliensis]|uniref:2-amino-4-hydroxy-6- hydroxymethyldihydropteridine diphosphokinase n=1 Tax=Kallipyga massiliensis TaxID=1472764 RepID=UPI0026EAA62D|nr:2-amino-4-hydroxy-6-hydroxymethyldihydropteridine diphosphokinase [Kallipyga massiliensis]
MDRIHIEKLTVFAHHGYYEEEARLGQKFQVTLDLYQDLQPAGSDDDIGSTTNYGEVCQAVDRFMRENRFDLIETCAEGLAQDLLEAFPGIRALDLTIHKPWAPVGLPVEDLSVTIHRARHRVFLGLGSNMGDRKTYLDGAIQGLKEADQVSLSQVSSYIETPPYGLVDQDPFLNAVAEIETTLAPYPLLDLCQSLEKAAGRVRKVHWGPRTLDVDILFYDQEILGLDRLAVPHPDLVNRAFVLEPMVELAPNFIHPVNKLTMAKCLEALEKKADHED